MLCPGIFLKSRLLNRGPRSFLGRQMGMENYNRSHFTRGKGPVVKSSRSIAGHQSGLWAQMSAKRLGQFSLQHIFSDKQRGYIIAISSNEFFSIMPLIAPLYKHDMHKISWKDQEQKRKKVCVENSPSNTT